MHRESGSSPGNERNSRLVCMSDKKILENIYVLYTADGWLAIYDPALNEVDRDTVDRIRDDINIIYIGIILKSLFLPRCYQLYIYTYYRNIYTYI